MASAGICTSLPEHQQPFTFASPISETYDDAHALDFDYASWIEQSKIRNCFSAQGDKLWVDDADGNHQGLPEDAYELSLRDLSELSSMEGPGLIIKLFMPSPSRSTGGDGRKKSFPRLNASMLFSISKMICEFTGNQWAAIHSSIPENTK